MRARAFATALVAVVLFTAACTASQPTGPIHSHGRTLLTYPPTGTSADARIVGLLGENGRGCVTVGLSVILVPEGSTLLADGSIVVAGHTYRDDTVVSFGGGVGKDPKGDPCDDPGHYVYVAPL